MRPLRGDDGSVTLMLATFGLALLVSVGLVVDGGAKIAAVQQADRAAAEAARAAAQQIDAGAVQDGAPASLVPARAVRAGEAVLSAAGVTGTVRVTGPATVTVDTSSTRNTVFLGLIGIPEVTGTGEAVVDLSIRRTP